MFQNAWQANPNGPNADHFVSLILGYMTLKDVSGCYSPEPEFEDVDPEDCERNPLQCHNEGRLIPEALDRSLESTAVITATLRGVFESTTSGTVDGAADAFTISRTGPVPVEVIGIGEFRYVRSEGPNGAPWLQVRFDPQSPDSQPHRSFDGIALLGGLWGHAGIVGAIATMEQVGPETFVGVADLSQVGAEDESERAGLFAAAVKNASSIPYEATIDDQGRLTRLFYTLELEAGPVMSELVIGDFEEPVQIEAPAAEEVWEGTADTYVW